MSRLWPLWLHALPCCNLPELSQQADLAPLHSEQKGLIDFLVLAGAQRFVGFGPSTYSFFLKVRSARRVYGQTLCPVSEFCTSVNMCGVARSLSRRPCLSSVRRLL